MREPDRENVLITHLDWNEAERSLISYKWKLHGRFLDLLEPHLVETLRDWEQAIEQQAQQIEDKDRRNDFYEFHSDEYHEHLEFKVILLNSFFSASLALFENQLMQICQSAQRNSGSPFSVKDLGSSSPTDRAKKYLRKLGVAFPADTPEWQEITNYRAIRNMIMHEGGVLPLEGHITNFAKAKKIVYIWGGNPNLALTRSFCDDALKNLRQFLLKIYHSYVLWLKANK